MKKIKDRQIEEKSYASNVEQIREQIRNKSMEKYGRPDVPSYVQRAAESYSLRKRLSNLDALNVLIAEAGSYEGLVSQLSKEQKKRAKKTAKMEKEKSEIAIRANSLHSQHYRLIESSKRSRYVSFVSGGAPGLGKKA